MKETGIIFSTPMVQAYQKGLKTVTRRTRGLEIINQHPNGWKYIGREGELYLFQAIEQFDGWKEYEPPFGIKCPYGGKGDVLRVKEVYCHKVDPITAKVSYNEFWYRATDPDVYKADGDGGMELTKKGYQASPWKSPLFMPKEASRYFLPLVSDPIPERLQSINWEDCHAEGILRFDREHPDPTNGGVGYNRGAAGLPMRYESKDAYMDLWDFLNGKKHPWSSNPWLWPLRFERYKP